MSYDLLFNALRNPIRRAIILALGDYCQSVAELHQYLLSRKPLPNGRKPFCTTRAAISQHLQILLEAGLVFFLDDYRRHNYVLDVKGFDEIRAYLDSIENLPGFFH